MNVFDKHFHRSCAPVVRSGAVTGIREGSADTAGVPAPRSLPRAERESAQFHLPATVSRPPSDCAASVSPLETNFDDAQAALRPAGIGLDVGID